MTAVLNQLPLNADTAAVPFSGQFLPPQRPKAAQVLRRTYPSQHQNYLKNAPHARSHYTRSISPARRATLVNRKAGPRAMDTRSTPTIVFAVGNHELRQRVADWLVAETWDDVNRMGGPLSATMDQEGFPLVVGQALAFRYGDSMQAVPQLPDGLAIAAVVTLKASNHGNAGGNLAELTSVLNTSLNWTIDICPLDRSTRWGIALQTSDPHFDGPSYSHFESDASPGTVFCDTVDDAKQFVDPTGTALWWNLPLDSLQTRSDRRMIQVLAQLFDLVESASNWEHTEEAIELLEIANRYGTPTEFPEFIFAWLDQNEVAGGASRLVATDEFLKLLGIQRPNDQQRKEITAVMREIVGEPIKVKGRNYWHVPVTRASSAATE